MLAFRDIIEIDHDAVTRRHFRGHLKGFLDEKQNEVIVGAFPRRNLLRNTQGEDQFLRNCLGHNTAPREAGGNSRRRSDVKLSQRSRELVRKATTVLVHAYYASHTKDRNRAA